MVAPLLLAQWRRLGKGKAAIDITAACPSVVAPATAGPGHGTFVAHVGRELAWKMELAHVSSELGEWYWRMMAASLDNVIGACWPRAWKWIRHTLAASWENGIGACCLRAWRMVLVHVGRELGEMEI